MSFGKIIPDSVQLHYSFTIASILIGHYILKDSLDRTAGLDPDSRWHPLQKAVSLSDLKTRSECFAHTVQNSRHSLRRDKSQSYCPLALPGIGPRPFPFQNFLVTVCFPGSQRLEDMMYYTTKFCSEANPNPKPNSKSTLSKSQKRRHDMRLPRGYVDFRWFFRHLV